MTTYCSEPDCGRPASSTTLCAQHSDELEELLLQVDWVIDQLRVALARQENFKATRGGSSGETPIAWNDRASRAARAYVDVVTTWQGRVADHIGIPVRYPNPLAAATWLLVARPRLNAYVDAGKMLVALSAAHDTALDVINRPADGWYAGVCSATRPDDSDCPRDLYADDESGVIVCSLCGARHDIQSRRAALLEYAMDHLATATEIARAVVVWSDYARGENRLVKRISTWEERGRIHSRGVATISGRQRRVYRLGDVVDLLSNESPESSPRAS